MPGKRKKRVDIPQYDDIDLLIQIFAGPRPSSHHAVKWSNRKIAFALCAFAGLRAGEVAALHWDAIDLPGRRLRVVDEVGTHSTFDGLGPPKTEAGVRTIPLCQYLYDALLDHAAVVGDRTGYVWKRKHGGLSPEGKQLPAEGPISMQEVSDSHRAILRAAGLVKPDGTVKFTCHALRHWYASACLAIGVKLFVVSKRLGHSQPSITTDLYGHVLEGDEDGIADEVAPIWHERLARARPDSPRLIDGEAPVLMIEGPRP